jgi:hypothetical protein
MTRVLALQVSPSREFFQAEGSAARRVIALRLRGT